MCIDEALIQMTALISEKREYQMKRTLHIVITALIITLTLNTAYILAQDSPQWHLPEGAKARLDKGYVSEVDYSPDGTMLAVASGIGIWMYDAQTGEELKLLTGQTGFFSSTYFSPDGNTVASGSGDGTILLWELPSTSTNSTSSNGEDSQ